MADNQPTNTSVDNTQKDPDDWTTGGEPATGAQMSYAKTMADEAGVDLPATMTKAEASEKIGELQAKTGRQGTGTNG